MNNLSQQDLHDQNILRENKLLLEILLKDQTTGNNIKWGTDSYHTNGYSFYANQEITSDLITGWYEGFIRPRAAKNTDEQQERQRSKAEVFTPSWIIKIQVDAALEGVKDLSLIDFLKTKWLEITCGEAPYMVNRYDMNTGKIIKLDKRAGFMDRKFKRLNEEVSDEDEWIKLALLIYQSSYGYEYQGDSLLLARENLMLTFIDNYFYMFGAFPEEELILEVLEIISLNIFQMDGLTYEVPYSDGGTEEIKTQLSLFEEIEIKEKEKEQLAKIKLWNQNKSVDFKEIVEGNDLSMKFDVVIGNPPYQIADGGAQSSSKPVYHYFVESGMQIASNYLTLIIPTRWYVGGKGLNDFRHMMLNNHNIKELHDFVNPKEVFPNTNIRGGVCYFLWDANYDYSNKTRVVTHYGGQIINDIQRPMKIKDINIFVRDPKAAKILEKVMDKKFKSFEEIVSARKPFGLATNFTKDDRYSDSQDNLKEAITCYSRGFSKGYVEDKEIEINRHWIDKWKVYTPYANNIGTELPDDNLNAYLGKPGTISTETYLVIGGNLDLTRFTANNLIQYLETKFLRYLLGLAKSSHHATARAYRFVPLQDFTEDSDIDWTKSISEIDQQLYKKYNLSDEEIHFIENNVKEME